MSTPARMIAEQAKTNDAKPTPRDHIFQLVDSGSFMELDAQRVHHSDGPGMERHRREGDGVHDAARLGLYCVRKTFVDEEISLPVFLLHLLIGPCSPSGAACRRRAAASPSARRGYSPGNFPATRRRPPDI